MDQGSSQLASTASCLSFTHSIALSFFPRFRYKDIRRGAWQFVGRHKKGRPGSWEVGGGWWHLRLCQFDGSMHRMHSSGQDC